MKKKAILSLKKDLIKYAKKCMEIGLVSGTGGNISVRYENIVIVTPSGYAFDELTVENLVELDMEGNLLKKNSLKPSIESRVHLACYRKREDIYAVVHCHPAWTIGVISTKEGKIPPMFPEFIDDIESVGYIPLCMPGSEEMEEKVSEVIKNNNICLIRNHGVFACGVTVRQAFNRTALIEDAAKAYIAAKITGTPKPLTKQQIAQISNLEAVKNRRKIFSQKR